MFLSFHHRPQQTHTHTHTRARARAHTQTHIHVRTHTQHDRESRVHTIEVYCSRCFSEIQSDSGRRPRIIDVIGVLVAQHVHRFAIEKMRIIYT